MTGTDRPTLNVVDAEELKRLRRENWGWFIALGFLLMLAGGFAVAHPHVTSMASTYFIGWVLMLTGVVQAGYAYRLRRWAGFGWTLAGAFVYLAAGIALVAAPGVGLVTLTAVLAVALVVVGLMEAIWAVRASADDGRFWTGLSGIVAIGLGLMIWFGLPTAAHWVLGLLVGINLFVSGIRFAWLGITTPRELANGPPPAA